MKPKVLIVEDDPEHAQRFSYAVEASSRLELVGMASSVKEALLALERLTPDIVLCDLGLPDGSGLKVIRAVRKRFPDADVCVVTVFGDERNVLASIEAGATGYVLKDAWPAELESTLLELRSGGSPISPVIARQLLRRLGAQERPVIPAFADEQLLSPREREVLQSIAKGFSYQEIADIHGLKVNTVTSHVKSIYRKLEVHSRGEAVFEAGQRGLLGRQS
jgi:DNA-binding NarL/FixJ family response regulator